MLHTSEKVIKHKVGLLNLVEELGNVRYYVAVAHDCKWISGYPEIHVRQNTSFVKLAC